MERAPSRRSFSASAAKAKFSMFESQPFVRAAVSDSCVGDAVSRHFPALKALLSSSPNLEVRSSSSEDLLFRFLARLVISLVHAVSHLMELAPTTVLTNLYPVHDSPFVALPVPSVGERLDRVTMAFGGDFSRPSVMPLVFAQAKEVTCSSFVLEASLSSRHALFALHHLGFAVPCDFHKHPPLFNSVAFHRFVSEVHGSHRTLQTHQFTVDQSYSDVVRHLAESIILASRRRRSLVFLNGTSIDAHITELDCCSSGFSELSFLCPRTTVSLAGADDPTADALPRSPSLPFRHIRIPQLKPTPTSNQSTMSSMSSSDDSSDSDSDYECQSDCDEGMGQTPPSLADVFRGESPDSTIIKFPSALHESRFLVSISMEGSADSEDVEDC